MNHWATHFPRGRSEVPQPRPAHWPETPQRTRSGAAALAPSAPPPFRKAARGDGQTPAPGAQPGPAPGLRRGSFPAKTAKGHRDSSPGIGPGPPPGPEPTGHCFGDPPPVLPTKSTTPFLGPREEFHRPPEPGFRWAAGSSPKPAALAHPGQPDRSPISNIHKLAAGESPPLPSDQGWLRWVANNPDRDGSPHSH